MSFSEILNILLGGGLVALVVAVATMKATVRKANADAEKARADAETVRITNTENANANIGSPLNNERLIRATGPHLMVKNKRNAGSAGRRDR